MSQINASSTKPNLVTLLPDLSNYTDWEDMIVCYMRSRECYHTVNPEDEIEKEMIDMRIFIAGDDKKQIALNKMKDFRANAEANDNHQAMDRRHTSTENPKMHQSQ